MLVSRATLVARSELCWKTARPHWLACARKMCRVVEMSENFQKGASERHEKLRRLVLEEMENTNLV